MPVAAVGEKLGGGAILLVAADVAQLVEHFTRNEGVRGSNPRVGSLASLGGRVRALRFWSVAPARPRAADGTILSGPVC